MNNTAKRFIRPFAFAAGGLLARTVGVTRTPDGEWLRVPPTMKGQDYVTLTIGQYEVPERTLLQSHFVPDDTIIEVGAHIGVVARDAVRTKLKTGGTYVAVEPDPRVITALRKNLIGSFDEATRKKIHIVENAIDDPLNEGHRERFYLESNLSSRLARVGDLSYTPGQELGSVTATSLSKIVNRHARFGYSLICDAEGAEIMILTRDSSALSKCRQILIELHHPDLTGRNVTPQAMVGIIEGLGFEHGAQNHNTHYFARPDLIAV